MFTEEDGNNEDRKEFYIRKNAKIYSILLTFKELPGKSAFLKIAVQAFET